MNRQPPEIGFRNEVTRVRPAVPEVIKNYPEKRFWKMTDAPFLSRNYLKYYFWGSVFFIGSYVVAGWVIVKFDFFKGNLYRGTHGAQKMVLEELPSLDDRLVYPDNDTFTGKFKARERQRLEQIKQAKLEQIAKFKAANEAAAKVEPVKTDDSKDKEPAKPVADASKVKESAKTV